MVAASLCAAYKLGQTLCQANHVLWIAPKVDSTSKSKLYDSPDRNELIHYLV